MHPKAVRIEWTPAALTNYSTRSNRQTAAMGGRAHGFDRRLQGPVFVILLLRQQRGSSGQSNLSP